MKSARFRPSLPTKSNYHYLSTLCDFQWSLAFVSWVNRRCHEDTTAWYWFVYKFGLWFPNDASNGYLHNSSKCMFWMTSLMLKFVIHEYLTQTLYIVIRLWIIYRENSTEITILPFSILLLMLFFCNSIANLFLMGFNHIVLNSF